MTGTMVWYSSISVKLLKVSSAFTLDRLHSPRIAIRFLEVLFITSTPATIRKSVRLRDKIIQLSPRRPDEHYVVVFFQLPLAGRSTCVVVGARLGGGERANASSMFY
jgi:hypothetical protein